MAACSHINQNYPLLQSEMYNKKYWHYHNSLCSSKFCTLILNISWPLYVSPSLIPAKVLSFKRLEVFNILNKDFHISER